MKKSAMIAPFLLATMLAGCSDPDDGAAANIGAACNDSVKAAEDVGADEAQYERALSASLDACASVDEWIAAAKMHPGVAVVTSAEYVDVSFLEIACRTDPNSSTAVCVDGMDSGKLDGTY
jgi:hypothetical protein